MKGIATISSIICILGLTLHSFSQTQNALIRKGNKLYKEGDFDKSITEYEQAVKIDPKNALANFNFANALFRKEKWEDAEKNFENVIANAPDRAVREKGFYNKGVALTKQKKLEESIDAYKNALRLDPNDEDARVNLQKALLEQRRERGLPAVAGPDCGKRAGACAARENRLPGQLQALPERAAAAVG